MNGCVQIHPLTTPKGGFDTTYSPRLKGILTSSEYDSIISQVNNAVRKHKPSFLWRVPADFPVVGLPFIYVFDSKMQKTWNSIDKVVNKINQQYNDRGIEFKFVRPTKQERTHIDIHISPYASRKFDQNLEYQDSSIMNNRTTEHKVPKGRRYSKHVDEEDSLIFHVG